MTACRDSAAAEPLTATAPPATAWLVLEQPGPWGRDAVSDSHLPDALAAHLQSAKGTGVSVLLARHPDRPERSASEGRHVWFASTAPGHSWMREAVLTDDAALLECDFAAIASGSLPAIGSGSTTPLLLVCTHSGRDACCAVHGRALVTSLMSAGADRSRLWECSHLGGHRFAPTALSLPTGTVFGRLDLDSAQQVMDDAARGQLHLAHYRGRSAFPQALQAAEIKVREVEGITDASALDVLWVRNGRAIPVPPGATLDNLASLLAEVRHMDGRSWHVPVRHLPLPRARMESCGKDPVEGAAWVGVSCIPIDPWRS